MIYSVFVLLGYGISSIQTVNPGLKTEETDNESFSKLQQKIACTMKLGEYH